MARLRKKEQPLQHISIPAAIDVQPRATVSKQSVKVRFAFKGSLTAQFTCLCRDQEALSNGPSGDNFVKHGNTGG